MPLPRRLRSAQRPWGDCRRSPAGGMVLCVAGMCLAVASPLQANSGLQLEASVAAGGGYDSNALLEIRPDNVDVRAKGGFVGVEPEAGLAWRYGDWRLYARASALLRQSPQFGFVAWNTADLGAAFFKNTSQFAASLSASHFRANQFADERLWGLGPQLLASTALSQRWRLQANLLSQWRRALDSSQRLDAAGVALRFAASSRWHWGARGNWMSLASDLTSFDLPWKRVRVGPYVQADLFSDRLLAQVGPFVGVRQLNAETARQYGAVASIEGPLAFGVGWEARFDWTQEAGPAAAGRADRSELWIALTWRGATGRPGVIEKSSGARRTYAPLVQGNRALFRLPAKAAKTVRVVGSFDNWAGGVALKPGPDGVWQAWVTLPPGPIRYHFLVDDVPRKPPDSPRYVADGFGGVDGEIQAESSSAGDARVSPTTPPSF
jgi:hypothetical protein